MMCGTVGKRIQIKYHKLSRQSSSEDGDDLLVRIPCDQVSDLVQLLRRAAS